MIRIQLPTKKGNPNYNPLVDFRQIVVLGANGAGKTRFGSKIEETYFKRVHRISAQKTLAFPTSVSTTSKDRAQDDFFYGPHPNPNHDTSNKQISQDLIDQVLANNKKSYRWKGNYNNSALNDFDKLLVLLHTEEFEAALNYKEGFITKPVTKLDIVQKIWETLLPHRKLIKRAGTIEVSPIGQQNIKYNASEMSDGERVIFYLIGEIVCVPAKTLIIIDEPEMHLHKSILKSLFDLVESERNDCSFLYLTHDVDFAFSRQEALKIWAKSYEGNDIWDYEFIPANTPIPEQLYFEILGSRKPVIFLEGDNSSLDYMIYQQVYSDYTLKPLGSCEKVIQSVKSINELKTFHHINSYGIIDRDRRQQIDIISLNSKNIWVLDVAESENLLLIENIVYAVANHMGKDPKTVFEEVKSNLIVFFSNQLEAQILLHFKELLKREFLSLTNFSKKNGNDVISEIDEVYGKIDKQKLYDNVRQEFESVVRINDYDSILRLFNLKNALIPNSKVCELTGISSKIEYINLVIMLLKRKDSLGNSIIQGINNKIIKNMI